MRPKIQGDGSGFFRFVRRRNRHSRAISPVPTGALQMLKVVRRTRVRNRPSTHRPSASTLPVEWVANTGRNPDPTPVSVGRLGTDPVHVVRGSGTCCRRSTIPAARRMLGTGTGKSSSSPTNGGNMGVRSRWWAHNPRRVKPSTSAGGSSPNHDVFDGPDNVCSQPAWRPGVLQGEATGAQFDPRVSRMRGSVRSRSETCTTAWSPRHLLSPDGGGLCS